MTRDGLEAWANATAGLGVSIVMVWVLRALGLWDEGALSVAIWFFAASVARSYVLRRLFRRGERG